MTYLIEYFNIFEYSTLKILLFHVETPHFCRHIILRTELDIYVSVNDVASVNVIRTYNNWDEINKVVPQLIKIEERFFNLSDKLEATSSENLSRNYALMIQGGP